MQRLDRFQVSHPLQSTSQSAVADLPFDIGSISFITRDFSARDDAHQVRISRCQPADDFDKVLHTLPRPQRAGGCQQQLIVGYSVLGPKLWARLRIASEILQVDPEMDDLLFAIGNQTTHCVRRICLLLMRGPEQSIGASALNVRDWFPAMSL